MTDQPLISVIMPIYNVEKYLKNCLDSVLAQSFKDFELICVNDGSSDGSAKILTEYAAKDKRIVVVNQTNKGLSGARNSGLRHAQGKWIYFIDSDDAIHPQLLEIAYTMAEKHKADMVSFSYVRSCDDSVEIKKIDIDRLGCEITDNPLHKLLQKGKYRIHFNVWSKLFKRTLIEGIDFVEGIAFEDYPFTYRVVARKPKTVLLNEKLYFYTYNPQSISRKQYTPKYIKDYQAGVNDVYKDYLYNHQKDIKYIRDKLVPSLLKTQYKQCKKTLKSSRTELWRAFAVELSDLQQKNLLSCYKNNFLLYWRYRFIIKKYGQGKKIVKIQGGLGNQMFQYAFGQAVEVVSGCPVLYDISWFGKKHKKLVAQREYMLSLFNNVDVNFASKIQAKIFAGKSILYKFWSNNVTKISEDGYSTFCPEWLNIPGNVYYDGYFQNEQYFKDIESEIRHDFTFSPISKDDEFNQKWLKKIAAYENSVCIHIRRGDYLNLDGWLLPIEYYKKAVEYIATHVNNPTFFVFGSECEDFIKNEFKIDYPFEFIGENNALNHEDWKDIVLMKACKHCIVANSTFSWWAAWLGDTKQKDRIVIAPSPFVKNDEIIPPSWIKIKR